jgi:hypothetical protein
MSLFVVFLILTGLAFESTRGPTIAFIAVAALMWTYPVATTIFLVSATSLYAVLYRL